MRKALVTGGAGFIGSHLVDGLVARGEFDQIVVYDNLQRGRLENIGPHISSGAVRFVEGDVRNGGALRAAMTGATVVFHLAGQSSVVDASRDVEYTFTTNITGTFNVLIAAKQCGVRRVVFASSREVYGEPAYLPVSEDAPLQAKNAYGASKIAAEMACQSFARNGLEVAVLRVANVYGPRDYGRVVPIFVENALRGEPLIIYGGRQVIDFVWVGDVVEVLAEAGLRSEPLPGPVNAGSGVGTALQNLARRVLTETGSDSQVQIASPRSVEVERFTADLARFQTVFRREPAEPLRYLSDVIAYIRSRHVECETGVAHRESCPTALAPVHGRPQRLRRADSHAHPFE